MTTVVSHAAMSMFLELRARQGDWVGREELLASLARTEVGGQAAPEQLAAELHAAFGQADSQPLRLEWAPERGFRLTDVTVFDRAPAAGAPGRGAHDGLPAVAVGGRRRNVWRFGAAAVLLAATMLAILLLPGGGFRPGNGAPGIAGDLLDAPPPPVAPNSLAILDFEGVQPFADMLVEETLVRFNQVPGLRVASRRDSRSLEPGASAADVRRRLRVAWVVEGSVREVDGELRVFVELIDTQSGRSTLTRTFARATDDPSVLMRDLTELVVGNLSLALPARFDVPRGPGTGDPGLYEFVRRGRLVLDGPKTLTSIDAALAWFERALDIDPQYPLALAEACRAHIAAYRQTLEATRMSLADRICHEAATAGARVSDVQSSLGELRRQQGRLEEALDHYRSALEADPRNVEAMLGMAQVFDRQGRGDEAEALFVRASEARPGDWNAINRLANHYFASADFARAVRAYNRLLFLEPDNHVVLANYGAGLIMLGEFEAALHPLSRAVALEPRPSYYSNLGAARFYLGRFEAAAEAYRQALALTGNADYAWVNLADALYLGGRHDEALDAYLEAAAASRRRLRVDAATAEPLYLLAWAETRLGRHQDGYEAISRALRSHPDDYYVHYYHALIETQLGDGDAAARAVARARTLGYPETLLAADPNVASMP
jgi:tetratricopeptide (TPR) repeat protein/TolB-like protein